MEERFALGLLGPFSARLKGDTVLISSVRVRALLAYLTVEHGRPHERTRLASLFWPESSDKAARDSLRQTLSLMRKAIQDRKQTPPFTETTRQTVLFQLSDLDTLDTRQLHHHHTRAKATLNLHSEEAIKHLRAAAALVRGSFMEGEPEISEPFTQWQRQQAVQLQRESLRILELLADAYFAQEKWGQVEELAHHQLQLEPWRESAHRQLMRSYVKEGRRTDALTQYERCSTLLLEELGVRPSSETNELHQRILKEKVSPQPTRPTPHHAENTDANHEAAEASHEASETNEAAEASHEASETNEAVVENHEASEVSHEATEVSHEASDESTAAVDETGEQQALVAKEAPLDWKPLPSWKPFVGRQTELQELEAWVTGEARLVTLLGMGGMGKTSLAQKLLRQVKGSFPDGVGMVSLVGVGSYEELLGRFAETLGLSFAEGANAEKQLLRHLQRRRLLLLLDNMEQLIQPRILDFLSALLQQTPGVTLLVTSRERLQMRAERVYQLEGLGSLEQDQDAVALFCDGAERANPSFLQESEASDKIKQICQAVAWSPLAIELAAALTASFSLADIHKTLQHNIDALTSQIHELPTRHRSLRAVFTPSWKGLTPEEQRVFVRCSVFQGGFTLEAAQQVADATAHQLAQLLSKSLLRQQSHERYEIHELLRQYAAELHEGTETSACHAAYYTTWMSQQVFEAFGETDVYDLELPLPVHSPLALKRIATEMDNIYAAWRWNLQHATHAELSKHLEAMWQYLRQHQRWSELAALLRTTLSEHGQSTPDNTRQALWHYQLGMSLWNMGMHEEPKGQFQKSFELLGGNTPQSSVGKLFALLGLLLRIPTRWWPRRLTGQARKKREARALIKLKSILQSLRLAAIQKADITDFLLGVLRGFHASKEAPKEAASQAVYLSQLYLFLRKARRDTKAAQVRTRVEALCQRWQHPTLDAYVHFFFAQAEASLAPWPQVIEHLEIGIAGFSPSSHRAQWHLNILVLFLIHIYRGDYAKADATLANIEETDHLNANNLFAVTLYNLKGILYSFQGRLDKAQEVFDKGTQLIQQAGTFSSWHATFRAFQAWIALRQNHPKQALDHAHHAASIIETELGSVTPYLHHCYFICTEVYAATLFGQPPLPHPPDTPKRFASLMKKLKRLARLYPLSRGAYYLNLGRQQRHKGHSTKAKASLLQAIHWAREMETPFEEALSTYELSLLSPQDQRAQLHQEAQALLTRLGSSYTLPPLS